MKVDIIKGKEIEFIDSIVLLKKLIDNEPYIDKFINSLNIDIDEIEELDNKANDLNLNTYSNLFQRIDFRKNIQKNNSGKFYSDFSKGRFDCFMQSSEVIQLIGVHQLWEAIKLYNQRKYNTDKEILITYYYLNKYFDFKTLIFDWFDSHYNSEEVKLSFIDAIPFEQLFEISESQETYILTENNSITEIKQNKEEHILYTEILLEDDNTVITFIDDIVYKLSPSIFGYNIEFGYMKRDVSLKSLDNIDFHVGINLKLSNKFEISAETVSFYMVRNRDNVLCQAQEQYSKYSFLLEMNPVSDIKKETLKARNTFIEVIYSIVNSSSSLKKASKHVKETIAGFIAYDFGIISLIDEYHPSDNLSSENEYLRKSVSNSISSKNKFIISQ